MKRSADGLNAYQVLGVPKSATPEDVRKAYLALAKVWHPDVCSEPQANERFQSIQAAYSLLKDSGGRELYDAIEEAEKSKDALAEYRRKQAERRAETKRRRGRHFGGRGGLFR